MEKFIKILDEELKSTTWTHCHGGQSIQTFLSDNKSGIFLISIEKYFHEVGASIVLQEKHALMKMGRKYGVDRLQTLRKIYVLVTNDAAHFNDFARKISWNCKAKTVAWWFLIGWFVITLFYGLNKLLISSSVISQVSST